MAKAHVVPIRFMYRIMERIMVANQIPRQLAIYCHDCVGEVTERRHDFYTNTIENPDPIEDRCDRCGYRPQEVTYHLWDTTAPKSYDGFGTLTVIEPEDMPARTDYTDMEGLRRVAILPEHEAWQVGRYWSGLNFSEEVKED